MVLKTKICMAGLLTLLAITPTNASIIDFALGVSSLSTGVMAISNVANTVSQIKQNAQLTNALQMQNAVYGQQLESQGYNLNYNAIKKAAYEQKMMQKETKDFILKTKEEAKLNNDTEMLDLINRYYKSTNKFSYEYTQNKILELQETRK